MNTYKKNEEKRVKKLLLTLHHTQKKSESETSQKKSHIFFMNGRWKKMYKSPIKAKQTTIFLLFLSAIAGWMCIKLCNYTFSLTTASIAEAVFCLHALLHHEWGQMCGGDEWRVKKIHSITTTTLDRSERKKTVWKHMAYVYFIFYCKNCFRKIN